MGGVCRHAGIAAMFSHRLSRGSGQGSENLAVSGHGRSHHEARAFIVAMLIQGGKANEACASVNRLQKSRV